MLDITELMDHYRDVARSLWNTAFWAVEARRNWDAREQFDQVRALLFKAMVLAQIEGGHCCDPNTLSTRAFRVVPREPGPVPIVIERPRPGDRNHYWDDPVKTVKASEVFLRFLDYFDWDLMNRADFQYYRVRIESFPGQPHLAGREALLEHLNGRVFLEDSSNS